MQKKPIIIISVLCVIALALGYLSGSKDKGTSANGGIQTAPKATLKNEPKFLKEGLVAYYPFNGDAKDESGNEYDGKIKLVPVTGKSMVARKMEDRHGNLNSALRFNGRTWVDIGNVIKDYANCTVSGWVNPDGGNWEFHTIISVGNNFRPDKHGFNVGLRNHHGAGRFYATLHSRSEAGSVSEQPENSVVANKLTAWHHVVAVTDQLSVRLYVNGVPHSAVTHETQISLSELSTFIGGLYSSSPAISGSRFFYGDIDDVRIYNRALSAEEVKTLYEFERAE